MGLASATLAGVFVAIQILNGIIIPPLVAFVLAFTVLAMGLVRGRGGSRTILAGSVLAVLAVLGILPSAIADLSHPETPVGFVPTVVALVAAVTLVISAQQARRRAAASGVRPVAATASTVIFLAVLGSAAAAVTTDDAERQPGDVVVAAADTEYPARLEAANGDVAFFVMNEDLARHTFLIEGTDVSLEVPGSRSRRVETTLQVGQYRIYCDVAGHEDMEGTLVVSDRG